VDHRTVRFHNIVALVVFHDCHNVNLTVRNLMLGAKHVDLQEVV